MAESEDVKLLQRRARRRLVGAIALAVFVVIALPIIFDREPKPITQDLVIEIPSQDSSRIRPLAPPPSPQSQPAPEPEKKPEAKAEAKAPETKAEAKAAPSREPDTRRAQAILDSEAYVVPLGAYVNAGNAKQVQAKAAAAGFKAYSETMKGAKGDQLRVRAGPFSTREAAEQAREKLKSQGLPVGAVVAREQP